jgi:hypothetical protein
VEEESEAESVLADSVGCVGAFGGAGEESSACEVSGRSRSAQVPGIAPASPPAPSIRPPPPRRYPDLQAVACR